MFFTTPIPNDEAVAAIRGKAVVTREVFDALLPELRARAIVASGVESADVVQQIRDKIAELPAGGDWEEIKRSILRDLTPWLVDDALQAEDAEAWQKQMEAAERRAELLIRTHAQQAYAAQQWREMDEQREFFPFWQYQSMGDSHVRHSHRLLDGIVLPHDHEFWRAHFPPWEFGCRCLVVPLMEADVEDMRAEDADKPELERRVLEGPRLRQLEVERKLTRGETLIADVRSPEERGDPNPYRFDPDSLALPLPKILARYDAETQGEFLRWAERRTLDDGRTVLEWAEQLAAQPR